MIVQTLLSLHVLAGLVALGAAAVAVAVPKGATLHRHAGRAYTLAMLAVSASALVLATIHPDPFLFAVGVFSFYLVFTGWRAAVVRDGRARRLDRTVGAAMTVAGAVMLGWGAVGVVSGAGAQPIVLLVFGLLGAALALSDRRDWRRGPIAGKERIARHLGRMLGGTIATITAAGVVNLHVLPDLVVWLGPTALVSPVIAWWTARVMRGAVRA